MRRIFVRQILIGTLITLLAAGVALAGETVTLSVGFSIPAIPGVNAPPFEAEGPAISDMAIQEVTTASSPTEEQQRPILLAKSEETPSGTVQTIYSR